MITTQLLDQTDRRRSIPLSEVAELTGIPLRTLQLLAQRGQLPGAFKPVAKNYKSRDWRVHREPLEAWWAEQSEIPKPAKRPRRNLQNLPNPNNSN